MKFEFTSEQLNAKTFRYFLYVDGAVLSFSDWMRFMLTSQAFVINFNRIFVESTMESYFWEVRPLTRNILDKPFEFVLVESKKLPFIKQNGSAFKAYFRKKDLVVVFPSLRKDAQLIVPTPISENTNYSQISKFSRSAEEKQIIEFWKNVALVYREAIGTKKKWLSTSGLDVYWLHVRVDSRPKYYQHNDYKN